MKKILILLSIAVLTVTSCSKEDSSPLQPEQISNTFVLASEKPSLDNGDGTKTEWTGSTIQWSSNDQICMAYTVGGVWQGKSNTETTPMLYPSDKLTAAAEVARFKVSSNFSATTQGPHIFYALYPASLVDGTSFSNAPSVSITIPSEQTPASSFFDAAADVMVGVSNEFSSKPSDDILMGWTRKVAHADLTLKNLSIMSGETIQKIRLTAQDGADLVGTHSINLKTGVVSSPSGTTNSIIINADNLSYSGNSIEFWASMLPATITELTVTVQTDKAHYTRKFTGFSREFKRNRRNVMNIGMGSAVRTALQTYEESFSNTLGDFTQESNPSLSFDVWTKTTNYGAKGTAYYNSTCYAVTSYLVSPELTIGSSNSALTFAHAANHVNGNFSQFFSVELFDVDAGTPITLQLDNEPSGSSWTYVNSTVDLGAYEGKRIKIRFKYTSTISVAGTWEIKNFCITNVLLSGGGAAATGWLELPTTRNGNDYFNGKFYVGDDRNYSYLYQYSTYTCLWVAYPLYEGPMTDTGYAILGPYTSNDMSSMEDRGTTWQPNPDITPTSKQVNCWDGSYNVLYGQTNPVNDASSTGQEYYARGHQIPNADRKKNDGMQTQTYYATNSTPQLQKQFNSTIWGQLEAGVRSSVKDTVYVATGAAFAKVGETKTITYIHPKKDTGKSVPVPNYYWKVLLKVKRNGDNITNALAVGFWFVHEPYSTDDYTPYSCSVDQIEEWTGFDFFTNLPVSLQEIAETNTNWTTFKNF